MKRTLIGSAIVFSATAVATSLVGCGGRGSSDTELLSTPSAHHYGSLGMQLTLPGGTAVTSVNWTLSQGAAVVLSGTQPIASTATAISFLVPNVPGGAGYTIGVNAVSSDGSVHCVGSSAAFSVAAQQLVPVNLLAACTDVTLADAGGVEVNGTAYPCATWTSAGVSASLAAPGQTLQLVSSAVGPNAAGVTYLWTASAGTIDTPNQAIANFTCPSTQANVAITLTVGDGPLPAGASCPATSSTTLNVACGLAPCVGVGTGVPATPDAANGTCPAGSTNSAKDAQGNFCCVALTPCTAAGQTGCVQCTGSAGNLCTPTEAAIVQHDIAKGLATAAGPDAANSCYACLVNSLGVDTGPVTGVECGDLTKAADTAACLATLSCIFSTSCDSGGAISACYCGTAAPSGACLSGSANGACAAQEAAGLNFPVTDGADVLKNMTSTTSPSGIANNIFVSAVANGCNVCLQ